MNIIHERFTIRPVSEVDRADILSVYRQCEDFLALGPVPTASMAMVQADLDLSAQHGGSFCGIFDPGGAMMGVIDVFPKGYEGEPQTAFLNLLMIAQPYRSHGLGAAVVQAAEQHLVAQYAVDTIRAGVQVNNFGAIRFWARQGYATVSGPNKFPDGTAGFDLCKSLR
jgi:ribosomal protein S18 acetylase RimI-like enzyme